MNISRTWLQKYFTDELPSNDALVEALTFHVAEVEGVEQHGDDTVFDVKVLPDRAAYMLSHRGVAKELSAILNMPLKEDVLREPLPPYEPTDALSIHIEKSDTCLRYMGALVRGVKVGPSPEWLKTALEAVGHRSINNVVDATNYVMLNIGQPLHAFDAGKLMEKEGRYAITVRGAIEGEKITTLSGEEYILPEDTLLITDANADAGVGIAGVKGGKAAQISEETINLVIESANFDGPSIRRAAQALKLFTDASLRYQNKISPELAAYGMRDVLELIQAVAGGEVVGVVDVYPAPMEPAPVSVTAMRINAVLGSSLAPETIADTFTRLGLSYTTEGSGDETVYTITPPFERRDITIPEDLVEEVGRIVGYETIPGTPLPPVSVPVDQARFRALEHIKDFMIEHGYVELSTQAFTVTGEVTLANPLDQTRPALRSSLAENIRDALVRGKNVAPRVLGPASELKLFELGTVFKKGSEHQVLAFGYEQLVGKKKPAVLAETLDQLIDLLGGIPADALTKTDDVIEVDFTLAHLEATESPKQVRLGAYTPFSIYPFALRDIAVWTPSGTQEDEVAQLILKEAGALLVRLDLFDRFEKPQEDGSTRTSYAFRLVFESTERTLSDEALNPLMEKITATLNAQNGWEVR